MIPNFFVCFPSIPWVFGRPRPRILSFKKKCAFFFEIENFIFQIAQKTVLDHFWSIFVFSEILFFDQPLSIRRRASFKLHFPKYDFVNVWWRIDWIYILRTFRVSNALLRRLFDPRNLLSTSRKAISQIR